MQPFGGLGCGSSEAAVRKHESIVRATPSPPPQLLIHAARPIAPAAREEALVGVQRLGGLDGGSIEAAVGKHDRPN
jgi:hypothetical protein